MHSIIVFVLLQIALGILVVGEMADSSADNLRFDRVLVVVLENQPLDKSLQDPRMRSIIEKGTLMTNYHGLVNPSQPNYIGLLAGDLMGVHGDGNYDVDGRNLVDQMEEKGVSWKSYQENYPGNCFSPISTPDGLYFRKHNPFMSFNNVRNNPQRCAKIVNADEFEQDLASGNVPQFSFYTPNMDNNGHDTSLEYAAAWLNDTFLPKYLVPFNNTGNALLVITFDEGVKGNNKIYTLLVGDMIPEGHMDDTKYNHYSLLRLFQTNFGLGSLGRKDAHATHMTKKHYVKGTPTLDDKKPNQLPLIIAGSVVAAVVITVAAAGAYVLWNRRRVHSYTSKRRLSAEHLLVETVDV